MKILCTIAYMCHDFCVYVWWILPVSLSNPSCWNYFFIIYSHHTSHNTFHKSKHQNDFIIYLSGCFESTEVQTSNTTGKECPRKCLNQRPFMFAENLKVKVIPLYFCDIFTPSQLCKFGSNAFLFYITKISFLDIDVNINTKLMSLKYIHYH